MHGLIVHLAPQMGEVYLDFFGRPAHDGTPHVVDVPCFMD
jgi:hypothetical protein